MDMSLATLPSIRIAAAVMVALPPGLLLADESPTRSATHYITYHNQPEGLPDQPFILRTYLPNPGLETEVTARHGEGHETPRYSPKTGLLSASRNDNPITGIPAGIAVSMGPDLSYAWDTTECRLLYAWSNGFLDMEPYWGPPERGNRKGFDYVPRLIGNLFYKAKGAHPLRINGEPLPEAIRYTGNRRVAGRPLFSFQAGDSEITVSVRPGGSIQTVLLSYESSLQDDQLSYEDPDTASEVVESGPGSLKVLLRPNAAESYYGFKKEEVELADASAEAGEQLYQNFGCMACHSIDGSKNHGPTFEGLAGSKREFPGIGTVEADDDYLRESITAPHTKSVPGYPVGLMPAYPLNEKQVDSLVLYIQSLP